MAYLATPYDWGVVLSSARDLVFIRARLLRQHDWLAVDLHVYNVYGRPLEAPPAPLVRVAGGEQLAELPVEQADKIIPGGLTVGEFEGTTSTHQVGTEASGKPLGLGFSVNYAYSRGHETGKSTSHALVHPLRWELITKSWSGASPLDEGSFRRGLLLFKPPQANPLTGKTAVTIVLRTPRFKEFAHLDYKGFPSSEGYAAVPGSLAESWRYSYVPCGKAGGNPQPPSEERPGRPLVGSAAGPAPSSPR